MSFYCILHSAIHAALCIHTICQHSLPTPLCLKRLWRKRAWVHVDQVLRGKWGNGNRSGRCEQVAWATISPNRIRSRRDSLPTRIILFPQDIQDRAIPAMLKWFHHISLLCVASNIFKHAAFYNLGFEEVKSPTALFVCPSSMYLCNIWELHVTSEPDH